MDKKTEEFFDRLRTELEKSNSWPAIYLFKFIVPTDVEKIKQVDAAFDGMGAVMKTTQSKTGKFTSVSIDVQMQSPQAVIDKYIEVSTIEGIISL
ncbi:DUF493 family protein [Flavobacterium nitratireducens]|uniref:DUF493 family protein n=1 Tax=Flavobacterium nitratireducens TaxID=992289 RepID=UPI0024153DFC|nr:DUF493 family protein [Flavobacterium nitratireducens]